VIRFKATLPNGRSIVGPIQGAGGRLGNNLLHSGQAQAAISAMSGLLRAKKRALEGRPTGLHEPLRGHVAMYPDECAEYAGEPVLVPLLGTAFEIQN
jgi:hypothetical protein